MLILGRFSNGGLEVLEALAAMLREMKYLPIIFDFDRPSDRNYTETIMTLAGLSRFVVADRAGHRFLKNCMPPCRTLKSHSFRSCTPGPGLMQCSSISSSTPG